MKIRKMLDPRVKLVMVLCLSSVAVLIENIYMLMGVLIFTTLILIILKTDLLSGFKKMEKILWLVLIIAVTQSLSLSSGKSILTLGEFPILTTGGIEKGIEFILRMAVIIFSGAILTTSNNREIIQGLVQWKIPYEIAFMVSVSIRFLPMLTEEIKDVLTAIQLRGIELDKIPFHKKLKIYSYIFMPIIAATLIKSKKLSIAMEGRAFRAYPTRTSYRMLKMSFLDYVVIGMSIGMTALLISLYFL